MVTRKIKDKSLSISKIATEFNKADLMTKNLSAENIRKHLEAMNIHMYGGRADAIPNLKLVKNNPKEAAEAKRKRQKEYEKRQKDAWVIRERRIKHI